MRGDSIELGVQLQRGDEFLGAGDLEVHVAEGVLRAEDIGQCYVARLTVHLIRHQTHRDTGNRCLQRHTGIEQRQRRGTHRAHRGGAIGAQRFGDLPDGVGELFHAGQHRHQGTLGERAVADLAPLG